MTMTLDTIRDFVERTGGESQETDEGFLLSSVEAGESRFPLVMRLAEHWLLLTSSTLLKPSAAQLDEAFFRRLSQWNIEFRLARVTLDASGYVVVAVDLPAGDLLSFPLFQIAVDVLTYYTDLVAAALWPTMIQNRSSHEPGPTG